MWDCRVGRWVEFQSLWMVGRNLSSITLKLELVLPPPLVLCPINLCLDYILHSFLEWERHLRWISSSCHPYWTVWALSLFYGFLPYALRGGCHHTGQCSDSRTPYIPSPVSCLRHPMTCPRHPHHLDPALLIPNTSSWPWGTFSHA